MMEKQICLLLQYVRLHDLNPKQTPKNDPINDLRTNTEKQM